MAARWQISNTPKFLEDWTFSFRKQKVLSWDSELVEQEVIMVYKSYKV